MTLRSNVDIPGVPKGFEEVLKKVRGEGGAVHEKEAVPDLVPISKQIAEEDARREAQEESDPTKMEVGQLIKSKGVYLGVWEPKDKRGKESLGKIFDLYAAPEDLVDNEGNPMLEYRNHISDHIGDLQDWHGHDGVDIDSSSNMYRMIREDECDDLAKWFLPPDHLFHEYLYKNRNAGSLRQTFTNHTVDEDERHPNYYWTNTVDNSGRNTAYNFVVFPGGRIERCISFSKMAARVVRAELRMELEK